MLFKLENVLDVRAPPAVNRLIGIADDTDILLLLCQQTNQTKLERVSVLILVHQNVAKAIVVSLAHLRNIAQQSHSLNQQIVKIERIVSLKTFFVLLEHASNRSPALVDVLGPRRK